MSYLSLYTDSYRTRDAYSAASTPQRDGHVRHTFREVEVEREGKVQDTWYYS